MGHRSQISHIGQIKRLLGSFFTNALYDLFDYFFSEFISINDHMTYLTYPYFRNMKDLILEAWSNRELLKDKIYSDAVKAVIEDIDKGKLRSASPADAGWVVNEWVKQAILLYFGIRQMQTWETGPFEFYDKMLLKKNFAELGVRSLPGSVARYGSYIAKNVVLMPSFVNIGAYVDEGTMVDTWATVGSCAQIGKGVHLSGGVGIGGVLEPLQASPVII